MLSRNVSCFVEKYSNRLGPKHRISDVETFAENYIFTLHSTPKAKNSTWKTRGCLTTIEEKALQNKFNNIADNKTRKNCVKRSDRIRFIGASRTARQRRTEFQAITIAAIHIFFMAFSCISVFRQRIHYLCAACTGQYKGGSDFSKRHFIRMYVSRSAYLSPCSLHYNKVYITSR